MTASLLDRYVGADAVSVTLGGDAVAPSAVGPVTIRHGRGAPDQQPDAATCTFTVRSSALTSLPTIGAAVLVQLHDDAATWLGLSGGPWDNVRTRFTGHATDISVRPDSALLGPSTVTVTAASRRARLGRVPVGLGAWPAESDGDRAARILGEAAAGAGATVGTIDPGTVAVLARDPGSAMALGLLDQLAVDSGGTLAELRDGTLCWFDADHRRDTPLTVELRPAQVLAAVEASQRLGDIVNDLTVEYGSGGASVRTVDADSADPVTGYGPFAAKVSTQLADVDAAQDFADLQVGRRSRPRWSLPALSVDLLRTVTPAEAAALLSLEHAGLVAVTGFPTSGPFAAARLWVEGWTETQTRHAWSLVLSVSDYGRSGAAPRWVDLPADLTWADVPPDLTWLTAVGWDTGYATTGRWFDIPADLTWADFDPTTTWADA